MTDLGTAMSDLRKEQLMLMRTQMVIDVVSRADATYDSFRMLLAELQEAPESFLGLSEASVDRLKDLLEPALISLDAVHRATHQYLFDGKL